MIIEGVLRAHNQDQRSAEKKKVKKVPQLGGEENHTHKKNFPNKKSSRYS